MEQKPVKEQWGSRLGVILAVAGSAVGLGNFLRFPGQAAANGGGAFMIPYFISFLLLGIPICWAEWTMGRYGGRHGFNSAPGIFSVLWRNPLSKYLGALGLLIPVIIYMYYVYIESWCLAYAVYYAVGSLDLGQNPAAYRDFFKTATGDAADGAIFTGGIQPMFWFFLATFLINFYFVYRGLSKGIETFCKIALPLLILAAIIVVVRVLTLPEQPLSDPWQRSLAQAMPSARWSDVDATARNPATTPAQMKERVESAFKEYFDNVHRKATGYRTDIPTSPPAGYLNSEAGIALAMAELRAGERGDEFRRWIRRTRDTFDIDVKLQLQRLEEDQIKLSGQIDSLNTELAGAYDKALEAVGETERLQLLAALEQGRLPDKITGSSRATIESLRKAQRALSKQVDELTAARSGLLKTANAASMPSLEADLVAIGNGIAPDEAAALAVQHRSAALEVSELPRTVWNGLGYMWNPDFRDLLDAKVWIAAAGQIFFSLSVGFGVIFCYASYLRKKDDVVLSSLTACSTNEFCEVILGGLVALPATFIFLGTATTLDVIQGNSFGLGFNTLPAVFANMPAGNWFGAIWFFLLFLAGVTSSLSMLQPAIAFLEEGFGLSRRVSVASLGLLTMSGALAVVYFSKGGGVALGTMDFWVGSLAIFVLATIQVLVFGWVMGIDKGLEEAKQGAAFPIPRIFGPILKFVTPAFLLGVFGMWVYQNLWEQVLAVMKQPTALLTVLYMLVVLLFLLLLIALAGERWKNLGKGAVEEAEDA